MRIGIDVGGTFTDVVLVDDETGKLQYTKTLTTPKDPADGVLTGIEKILKMAGIGIDRVRYIVHGTTIGTNALIEKKGAKTGLITTDGFRDVLEIGRVQRPREGIYDFYVDNPLPLVRRYYRRGVRERVDAEGNIITPLDEEQVREVVRFFLEEKVESIAVCLLFSFLNPTHEKRIREIIQEIAPGMFVSLSCEISPAFREFERASTVVINAYLQPIIKRYIESLTRRLREKYGEVDLRIMQASGGTLTAEAAAERAVNIVNSGPAGGVVAASLIGELTKDDQLVSVDMGGTSFDIGLVVRGSASMTSEAKFEDYPVQIPVIDVHAIGAGGGSIAWIDEGGVLNVGPESAGADPGPACYGRGGTRPCVTDANLILGRLNPDYFLGGEMKLDTEKARKAVEEHVARPMGLSVEEAAAGIMKIVNANMAKGISVNSVERGHDVREFSLIAFGGAGPLHAADLARELQMRRVIVPPACGDFSAVGLLASDVRYDFVQTAMKTRDQVKPGELEEIFLQLEEEGMKQLERERIPKEDIEARWSVDLRYEGQSYELNTPFVRKVGLSEEDIDGLVRDFHALHRQIYAYSSESEIVEFVNLRVTVIGKNPPIRLAKEPLGDTDASGALKGRREVYFEGHGFLDTPIYERDLLKAGNRIDGPAVIEEVVSSTVVIPETFCEVDEFKNLIIMPKGE